MTSEMDVGNVGRDIIRMTRTTRRILGTDLSSWKGKLEDFIEAQEEVSGKATVRNIRPVGSAAGGSGGTLVFTADYDAGDGKKQRDLVLRYQPEKGLFSMPDLPAQFRIQKALYGTDVPVAKQLWLDAEGGYLGTVGYIMEKVEGTSPPMVWLADGIIAETSEKNRRAMIFDYISTLAKIHAVDWRSIGLKFLTTRGEGNKPMEREINWYWGQLERGGKPQDIELLAPVLRWLMKNQPKLENPILCHGDTNMGNYLFHNHRVVAVTDWEMAYLGSPEADIAFLQFGNEVNFRGLKMLPGIPDWNEWKEKYEQAAGRKLSDWDYYYTFAFYAASVIVSIGIPQEFIDANKAYFQIYPDKLRERRELHGF